MKTIVLFFVLLAFAAVTAKHGKRQKVQENNDEADTTNDWPQPQTLGEYSVPEGYDGPATSGGQGTGGQVPGVQGPGVQGPGVQGPGGNGDLPSGKSRVRSSRRHN